ncbi:hypothetical protein COCC4DRAFT_33756, partial [Bipolaris maydis ATCC 48331]
MRTRLGPFATYDVTTSFESASIGIFSYSTSANIKPASLYLYPGFLHAFSPSFHASSFPTTTLLHI